MEKSDGCLSQPTFDEPVDLLWRGNYICTKSDGEAQLKSATKMRPVPGNGTCKSGYQICGVAGTTNETRAVCVPTNTNCPITLAFRDAEYPMFSPPTGSGYTVQPTGDPNVTWYTHKESLGKMHINSIEIVLQD